MSNSPITQQLLWLDPFRSLSGPEQAQLAAAGLVAQSVATLDELARLWPHADVLALRLEGSTGLLTEVKAMLAAEGSSLPIVCRVERRDLELAVAAMRDGAVHVIAADEFSAPVWQMASAQPRSTPLAAQVLAKVAAPRTVVYVDPASRHLRPSVCSLKAPRALARKCWRGWCMNRRAAHVGRLWRSTVRPCPTT
jgi:two-component system response regulator FlrC